LKIYRIKPPPPPKSHTQHPEAQWFKGAGFGLFIHWGIHSVKGVQPSWVMIKNYVPDDEYIPHEEYNKLAEKFNPQAYDPDKWIAAARAAGMTYAVITTRHHDGYALWPSEFGTFGIKYLDGRDLIEPFVHACRRHGLKVGLYYSVADWNYPSFEKIMGDEAFDHKKRNPPSARPLTPELKALREEFYSYVKGQLTELLTRYGRIDLMWFDGGVSWPGGLDLYTEETLALVRKLQPHIVINDRYAANTGDYDTSFELEYPDRHPEGWWEACNIWPGQKTWGYNPAETFEPIDKTLELLARTVGWGGNLLINFGPRPDGDMPQAAYVRLYEMAQWMQHSRPAVIGVEGGPAPERCELPITRRAGVWYIHVLASHKGSVKVKNVPKPREVRLLRTGENIKYIHTNRSIRFKLPSKMRQTPDDVVAISWLDLEDPYT